MKAIIKADALHLPYKSNVADALVTDPPAGISFMGRKWDHDKGGRRQWVDWMTRAMVEALRVCKPGAHGFVWALPRTSHWTAWALEDAGWEIRDAVVHHCFGSGFPKSLDVSKAIDRAVGAERKVIGLKIRPDGKSMLSARPNNFDGSHEGYDRPWKHDRAAVIRQASITAPATPEAAKWQGWGSSLKPGYEVWWLVRKPLSESSIAANVLKWGTGGIHIDAGRIPTSESLDGGAYSGSLRRRDEYSSTDGAGAVPLSRLNRGAGEYVQPSGRWPTNLCFSHSEGCEPGRPCVEGCPVGELDRQSGVRPSCDTPSSATPKSKFRPKQGHYQPQGPIYPGDSGGASRFFRCFYTPKAGTAERKGAKHPTVKPLALMEYLIRLICPPGGRVLDPFAGSFTTLEAAMRTGREGLASDSDDDAIADGQGRMELVQKGMF